MRSFPVREVEVLATPDEIESRSTEKKPENGLTGQLSEGAGEEMRELLGERGYM